MLALQLVLVTIPSLRFDCRSKVQAIVQTDPFLTCERDWIISMEGIGNCVSGFIVLMMFSKSSLLIFPSKVIADAP